VPARASKRDILIVNPNILLVVTMQFLTVGEKKEGVNYLCGHWYFPACSTVGIVDRRKRRTTGPKALRA